MLIKEIVDKLIKIGYHYNFSNEYLYKTIDEYINEKRCCATCFYQNGKFEFEGNEILIRKLKKMLEEQEIKYEKISY